MQDLALSCFHDLSCSGAPWDPVEGDAQGQVGVVPTGVSHAGPCPHESCGHGERDIKHPTAPTCPPWLGKSRCISSKSRSAGYLQPVTLLGEVCSFFSGC